MESVTGHEKRAASSVDETMPDGGSAGRVIERNQSQPSANSTSEFYKEEVGWFEKITRIKRYFRTRRSIIDGENLFDLPDVELKSRDLMAPLRFNTYQTV